MYVYLLSCFLITFTGPYIHLFNYHSSVLRGNWESRDAVSLRLGDREMMWREESVAPLKLIIIVYLICF